MADWERVIRGLRGIYGVDTANRARNVAEAAPGADRQFSSGALRGAFRPGQSIAVGPGYAFSEYAPFTNNFASHRLFNDWSERNIRGLHAMVNSPNFSGWDTMPNLEYSMLQRLGMPDVLQMMSHDGRHRSAALGGDQTLVQVRPWEATDRLPPKEQLGALRVVPDDWTREGLPEAPASTVDPLETYYRLFRKGGRV